MKSGIQPNYQAAGDNTRRRSFPLSFPNPLPLHLPSPVFSRAPFFFSLLPSPPILSSPVPLSPPLAAFSFIIVSFLFFPLPRVNHAPSLSLSSRTRFSNCEKKGEGGSPLDRGEGASFFAPSPLPRQRPSHVTLCIFFHVEGGRRRSGTPRSWKCFSRTRRRRRRRR